MPDDDKLIADALRLARAIAAGRGMPLTKTVELLARLAPIDPVEGALRIARECVAPRTRLDADEEIVR